MAWLMAEKQHVGQDYGPFPYKKHLMDMKSILDQLIAQFKWVCEDEMPSEWDWEDWITDDEFIEDLICVIILHDALEDGRMSYNDVKRYFGLRVAEGVFCVSDDPGRDRAARKNYKRIKSNMFSRIAKLIDRYANLANSKQEGSSMLKKYKKEYQEFKDKLTVKEPHLFETWMWNHLDKLLNIKN